MLTHIVRNSDGLRTFVETLGLELSKPQLRHVLNVADALLVATGEKTLANLHRQFVESTDVSNMADTFRIGSWQAEQILAPLNRRLMKEAIDRCRKLPPKDAFLLVSIDDSLAIKDPDTRHLEGVDWHYDHSAGRRGRKQLQNGMAYMSCHVAVGSWGFTFAVHPYLREKTVRRLNRRRPKERRLHFISKPRLAQRLLRELQELIPSDIPVYVQFDIWFASKRLLKFIARQGWHTICRIRTNRRVSGQRVTACFASQRHRPCHRVVIGAADGRETTYLVRDMVGRLSGVPFSVRVLESRRHYRDHLPVYFVSTDLALAPQEALRRYAKRWSCETDNWYLKLRLGLGDFRLQSYEAIAKFIAVVLLAWAYVQWSVGQSTCQRPADVIGRHRDEHARAWLIAACSDALRAGSLTPVLQRYLRPAFPT
jgi:hypothetical protein